MGDQGCVAMHLWFPGKSIEVAMKIEQGAVAKPQAGYSILWRIQTFFGGLTALTPRFLLRKNTGRKRPRYTTHAILSMVVY